MSNQQAPINRCFQGNPFMLSDPGWRSRGSLTLGYFLKPLRGKDELNLGSGDEAVIPEQPSQ